MGAKKLATTTQLKVGLQLKKAVGLALMVWAAAIAIGGILTLFLYSS
ncbi:MAG: hypothetical protein WC518_02375 [Patescibacteria group bacterium]